MNTSKINKHGVWWWQLTKSEPFLRAFWVRRRAYPRQTNPKEEQGENQSPIKTGTRTRNNQVTDNESDTQRHRLARHGWHWTKARQSEQGLIRGKPQTSTETCCPRNMTQGDKHHRSRRAQQQKVQTRAWKNSVCWTWIQTGNSSVFQPLVQVSLSPPCLVSQRSRRVSTTRGGYSGLKDVKTHQWKCSLTHCSNWCFRFWMQLLWVVEVPQGSTRPSLQVFPPFYTVVLSCVYPAAQSLWCVLDKRQAVNSNWLQLPSTPAIKMLSLHVLLSTGPFYPLSPTQEMLFNTDMNQTWPVKLSFLPLPASATWIIWTESQPWTMCPQNRTCCEFGSPLRASTTTPSPSRPSH